METIIRSYIQFLAVECIVQAKGQVTIPLEVREAKGIKPGDKVTWVVDDRGEWVLRTFDELVQDLESQLDGFKPYLTKVRKGWNRRKGG
jgi:AbrB family looped-hinge helix DNA binding protein